MAVSEGSVKELESTQKFFKTTLSVFTPEDEAFAPFPELYTVAGHVAHAADSVDWFIEGAFGDGWDMEFDASIAKAKAVTSLDEAKEWLDRAFANAIAVIGDVGDVPGDAGDARDALDDEEDVDVPDGEADEVDDVRPRTRFNSSPERRLWTTVIWSTRTLR
jgi:hypothetical protein